MRMRMRRKSNLEVEDLGEEEGSSGRRSGSKNSRNKKFRPSNMANEKNCFETLNT